MPTDNEASVNIESKEDWGIPQWLGHFQKLIEEQNRKTFEMFDNPDMNNMPGLLSFIENPKSNK